MFRFPEKWTLKIARSTSPPVTIKSDTKIDFHEILYVFRPGVYRFSKNLEATPTFKSQMYDMKSSPPHRPMQHLTHIFKDPFSSPSHGRSTYIQAKDFLRPLGRPRRQWEDIKTDLQEMGCGGMDWIQLAQDRDRRQALVNVKMNLRVP